MLAPNVLFHRLAVREYHAAIRWYAQRSQQAPQRFEFEVDRAVENIAANPGRWPEYRPHFRWVRVRRFPYVLYHREVDANTVLVLAVAHGRRRPGYWLRRWKA